MTFAVKAVGQVVVIPAGKVLTAHAAVVIAVAAAGFAPAAMVPAVFRKMSPAHRLTPAH